MSMQVWTEKYRPGKLGEIVNQVHVVDRLKSWVKQGSVPNMLFAGSAGVGKTTAALCLAKELFGEHWRENFQETNASDQRGIDVVRGRIKSFAMMKPIGSDQPPADPRGAAGSQEDDGEVLGRMQVHPQLQLFQQAHRAHPVEMLGLSVQEAWQG